MIKRLLTFLAVFFVTMAAFAQNPVVSILGGSTSVGWTGDLDMTTTDGVTYTYSNLVVTVPSQDPGVKFRQAHAWTTNWGSTGFPTGTATQNGANIPATNGTYNVTFNRTTGAYSFVPVGVSYDTVVLMGGGASYTMSTADGINYSYTSITLSSGDYMFNINSNVSVGGTGFPTGTASEGVSITVPAGTYNVSFNTQTMAYSFGYPTVSLIGSAVDPAWSIDIDFATSDGVNYWVNGVALVAGEAKFRQSHGWDINWGSTDFPSGTGTQGGDNIAVTAGTYNITFNRLTGAYNFTYATISLVGSALDANWGVDVDFATTDGVTFTASNVVLAAGEVKFRQNHGWDVSWGAAGFPTGTATLGGQNIPVTAGTYDVSFNRNTGEYIFTAINSGFDVVTLTDGTVSYQLTTTDGVTYTSANLAISGGSYMFNIANNVMVGGTTFPSGTASEGVSITIPAGVYNVTFNSTTMAYSFGFSTVSLVGSAIDANWSIDIDMDTTDGITYTKSAVVLMDGEVKFRQNHGWDVNWGAAGFPSGTATQGGANIAVTAGTYDVTFNRSTGEYNFAVTSGVTALTKNSVTVYPNPAASVWNFSAVNTVLTHIKITDVTGKTVVNQSVNGATATVSATGLANGVYFATVTAGAQHNVVRLVKN